ncbi:MAG: amidohydrolase family protein, partial [Pseudomonadota bacterium]
MTFRINLVVLIVGAFFTSAQALANDRNSLAIVGVSIANPNGFELAEDATVLIDGDTIVEIGPRKRVKPPKGADVIDGRGKWLIPGLMELHAHFGFGGGVLFGQYEKGRPQPPKELMQGGVKSGGLDALLLDQYSFEAKLRALLRAGVTTVRSTGENDWAYSGSFEQRARAEREPMAPRYLRSTPLLWPRPDNPGDGRITTPEQGREAVRFFDEERDVDLLKIWFVDGKFSGEDDGPETYLELMPVVEAMLDEAKKRGMENGVDAIEVWRAKEVIKAGGNLVHGIFFGDVDDEYISLMKEYDVDQVWTAIASERYFGAVAGHLRFVTPEYLMSDPHVIAHLIDIRHDNPDKLVIPSGGSRFDGLTLTQAMKEPPYTEEITTVVANLRRAYEARLPMGMGTDVGIVGIPYGAALFAEFEHYLAAGMSPRDVLTAATINNAHIINMADTLGSITEGKKADLVLLNANPLQDIMNAAEISGVVRNGHYFSASELNNDTPNDVVTRLRNAYNGGDKAAIFQLLHENVIFIGGSDIDTVEGREA